MKSTCSTCTTGDASTESSTSGERLGQERFAALRELLLELNRVASPLRTR
jgi:hypothetical protein